MGAKMLYSDSIIRELEDAYIDADLGYKRTLIMIGQLHEQLTNESAKTFLLYGAGRRLRILDRCLKNIFAIFPPNRETALSNDELTEVSINLHASFVNLFGVFDNLAWVLVYEKNLPEQNNKFAVALYKKKKHPDGSVTYVAHKEILSSELTDYLNQLSKWYDDYLKVFRDDLAHQIPVYIPPEGILQDGRIISPFACFAGTGLDKMAMEMHVQLIADIKTVIEVINKFVEFEFPAFPRN